LVVAVVDLLDDLDTPVARSRAVEYKAEIAAIDRKLAAALRVSPAGRLMARGQDLRERWEQMDATLRSQVIDELMVVTVLPAKRGRGFDDDSVDIAWRKTSEGSTTGPRSGIRRGRSSRASAGDVCAEFLPTPRREIRFGRGVVVERERTAV